MMTSNTYIKAVALIGALAGTQVSASVISTFNSGTDPFVITDVTGPGFSTNDIGTAAVVNRDQPHMIDGAAYWWAAPLEVDKITFDDDTTTSWIEPPTSRGTWSKEDWDNGVSGTLYTGPTYTNEGEAPGTWTTTIDFVVPADASADCTYNLTGLIYADDFVTIGVDGTQVADPDTEWYQDPVDMGTVALGSLAPGAHTLEFTVTDTEGPSGLWTRGQIECDCIPEPGAITLFGLSIGLLGLRRRR